jgi:hypothetical protein
MTSKPPLRSMIEGTLALVLCLVCGGAAAAPQFGFSAIEPDAGQSVDAQSMDGQRPASGEPRRGARQFDLECEAVRHTSFGRPEDGVPDPPFQPTTVHLRYVVDLDSGNFCNPSWCTIAGVARLPAVDGERITFFDTRGPGDRKFEIFDRLTGRYLRRTHTIGLVWLDEGTCHEAPFSGFPDTSDMTVEGSRAQP